MASKQKNPPQPSASKHPVAVYGAPSSASGPAVPTQSAAAKATAPSSASGTFPQKVTPASSSAEQVVSAFNSQGTTGVSQFFAYYGITSSEQPMFEDVNSQTGSSQLNQNAVDYVQFHSEPEAERQQTQDMLVGAGLLRPTDATGTLNSASITAFKQAIANAAPTGQDTFTWLQQNGSGTNALQNQIAANRGAAEANVNKPVAANLTNPTEVGAYLQNAFAQALGFSPSQQELSAFVDKIHGQELTTAEAPRREAQAQVDQAKSEGSALNKLGPDGIDAFKQAYANAIHGTGAPGAGTLQGPTTGSQSINQPGTKTNPEYIKPGTPLAPHTTVGFNPSGTEMVANVPPTVHTTHGTKTEQVQNPNQTLGSMAGNAIEGAVEPQNWFMVGPALSSLSFGHVQPTDHPVHQMVSQTVPTSHTTVTQRPGMAAAPSLPPGVPNSIPLHGGIYALSPDEWAAAKKLTPAAKKYKTAGDAPRAVQDAAFTSLAIALYDEQGSWSNVAITLAGGAPSGKKTSAVLGGKVLGSSDTVQNFADSVAGAVNNQVNAIQGQLNNSVVTVKETNPNVAAEAIQAAKQADPVGYYAANFASWGSLLTKMLYGTPLTEMASTTDAFNGPVGATTTETSPQTAQQASAQNTAASTPAPSSKAPAPSSSTPATAPATTPATTPSTTAA